MCVIYNAGRYRKNQPICTLIIMLIRLINKKCKNYYKKRYPFVTSIAKRVSNGLTCLWATIEAFPETEQLYPYAVG